MADDDIKLPEIDEQKVKFAELKEILSALDRKLAEVTTSMNALKAASKENSDAYKDLSKQKEVLINKSSEAKTKLNSIGGALKETGLDAKALTEDFMNFAKTPFGAIATTLAMPFKTLGATISTVSPAMGAAITKFGASAKDAATAAIGAIDPLNSQNLVAKALGKTFENVNDALRKVLEVQNVARSAFIGTGQGLAVAEAASKNYDQTLRRMAASTGLSTTELHSMSSIIHMMPTAFTETSKTGTELNKIFKDGLTPATHLALSFKAFGLSSTDAANQAKNAQYGFNQSLEQTVKTMGTIAAASQITGVDRQKANEQIVRASETLAIFGQGSASAANVWTNFMSTLKNTVPIEQVGKIIESVTSGIAKMSTENRAFISMTSGLFQGASAVGGALKMELMMRQPGGMDKGLESLTQTLSKFAGGKIVTLEEAAKNPQLENIFMVQRQMLGQLSGIQDTEQQNRVLETLQNIQKGGISQVQGGAALKEIMKEGKTLADKQNTSVDRMDATLKLGFGGVSEQLKNIDSAIRTGGGQKTNVGGIFGHVGDMVKQTKKEPGTEFKTDSAKILFSGIIGGISAIPKAAQTDKNSLGDMGKSLIDGLGSFLRNNMPPRPSMIDKPVTSKDIKPLTTVAAPATKEQYKEAIKEMPTTTISRPEPVISKEAILSMQKPPTNEQLAVTQREFEPKRVSQTPEPIKYEEEIGQQNVAQKPPTISKTDSTITIKFEDVNNELQKKIMEQINNTLLGMNVK